MKINLSDLFQQTPHCILAPTPASFSVFPMSVVIPSCLILRRALSPLHCCICFSFCVCFSLCLKHPSLLRLPVYLLLSPRDISSKKYSSTPGEELSVLDISMQYYIVPTLILIPSTSFHSQLFEGRIHVFHGVSLSVPDT